MSDESAAFFIGIAVGVIVIGSLMAGVGTLPKEVRREIHQEAVNRGYGRWIINTNKFYGSSPISEFQWITNSILK